MTLVELERLFAAQRLQFPGLRDDVRHLNNAAGSELPESVIEAMTRYMRSGFINEGKIFDRLIACANLNRAAHEATADLVGATSDEVGLAANTTTALYAVTRALGRRLAPGERVLVSGACHEGNIAPWLALRDQGIVVDFIPMKSDTHIDYEWLEEHLDARTRVVSVGASSNATGTLHDIGRVVRAARTVGALVSLDAAHYAPHRAIDVRALDVDLLFLSGYKCFGPHLGAFYIRRSLCETLVPYSVDPGGPGHLEASRFETGTRNLEAYAGWVATVEYLATLGRAAAAVSGRRVEPRREAIAEAMSAIEAWETALTARADARLDAIPSAVCYRQPKGDRRPRLGVFSFNLRSYDPLSLARALADARVEGVVGHNGSIRTMAQLAPEYGGIGIRLSIAHYNQPRDMDQALEAVARLPPMAHAVDVRRS